MGLTHWRGKEIAKADTIVAKNYLNEKEIDALNRIVSMWLDFAEDQASMKKQIFLQDWTENLDAFLAFNDRQVLQTAGTISKTQADGKARIEYEKFAAARRLEKEQEGERHIAELLKLTK